ncbi:MAG TPA: alanine racemase [Acidimicrobiia bacterium]
MRPSRVEIDLQAIRHNTSQLSTLIAPARLCAVVKADGYGHGDVPVAEAALAAGATWLAVALVEEGVRLREAGIEAPVLLLSEPSVEDRESLLQWKLTPTAYTEQFIDSMAGTGLPVHVKIDTGMHRVGAPPESLLDLLDQAYRRQLVVEGIWTHFAHSEGDLEFTRHQIEKYDAAVPDTHPAIRHLANTAAAVLIPESRRDLVRAGIGLYGIHPGETTTRLIDLRPAMRIVSRVAYVQRLPAGSRPSYGRRRELPVESNVATVPIGYADGLPRSLSERGQVLVRGRRYPLAGTITMDQIVVDIGNDPVEVGDEVVLLGQQGSEAITADEWATLAGTIAYEIVCQIGPRLPRRYVE